MSLITGTIVDSAGNPLNGNLVVTLSGSMVEESVTPAILFVNEPTTFNIINGVVNIELEESENSKVSYKFEFFVETSPGEFASTQPSPFPFYAIVPNLSPVSITDLTPTGMVNDSLATGALRIARIIANDPELSANVGGLTPRGGWLSNVYYKNRDLVSYASKVYICRAVNPIVGVVPNADSPFWMLLPISP
jgi:hypothetical protein